MRMMVHWTVPVAKGNEAIQNGAIARALEQLTERLQPEAAYYMAWNGKRAGMMVFDMKDPSQIPQIAEPLFTELEAEVTFLPVMNADDLERALGSL